MTSEPKKGYNTRQKAKEAKYGPTKARTGAYKYKTNYSRPEESNASIKWGLELLQFATRNPVAISLFSWTNLLGTWHRPPSKANTISVIKQRTYEKLHLMTPKYYLNAHIVLDIQNPPQVTQFNIHLSKTSWICVGHWSQPKASLKHVQTVLAKIQLKKICSLVLGTLHRQHFSYPFSTFSL